MSGGLHSTRACPRCGCLVVGGGRFSALCPFCGDIGGDGLTVSPPPLSSPPLHGAGGGEPSGAAMLEQLYLAPAYGLGGAP